MTPTLTLMAALVALLSGCMSWPRGWEALDPMVSGSEIESEAEIVAAEAAFESAGSSAELNAARSTIRDLLSRNPTDERTLLVGAKAEILHGAAYDERRADKKDSYLRGIQYAERAMAAHPEFRRQVIAGVPLSEAVGQLERDQAEAMLLWVTGVSYYFKECLSGVGHLVNFRWMQRTSEVMEHLMAIAPDFNHGAVPFSLGIYYLALPESAGGDLERAGELLQTAVEQSGSSLLPRWGRAKYYWVKTGDKAAFRSDLEWVLAADPRSADSPYSWNVYFQRDAAKMLKQSDPLPAP